MHDIDVYTEEISKVVRCLADVGTDGVQTEASRLLWHAGYHQLTHTLPEERLNSLTHRLYTLAAELRLSENHPHEIPVQACLNDEGVYSAPVRRSVREIHNDLGETARESQYARRKLSGILWRFGWGPCQLDELEATRRKFREEGAIHRFQQK